MACAETLSRLIATYPARQEALLPILHGIQDALRWVPPEATPKRPALPARASPG